jgi:hypothetical protein
MSAHGPLSFDSLAADTSAATGATETAGYAARPAIETAPALRYSSPRPWILGLAISSAMWVGIGWLIWTLVE